MRTTTATPARWLAAPVTAALFAFGVWVAGGVITDGFRASMALTAAWYALAGAAAIVVARRSRALRVPVLGGYAVAAAGIAAVLAWTTLRDKVVHERVAVGPVEAQGTFRSGEHATSGVARIVRAPGGRRVLTLTGFATAAGPDLRVRLAPGGRTDGGAGGVVDLGALKGNIGDQQYALPRDLPAGGRTVLIWCRAFSALFGSARLRAT